MLDINYIDPLNLFSDSPLGVYELTDILLLGVPCR